MNNTFYREDNLSGLKRTDFQKTVQGKETDLFILSNNNGAEVAVTNYGGAILAIMVPDKNGNLGNVIQGHDGMETESVKAGSHWMVRNIRWPSITDLTLYMADLPVFMPVYGMPNNLLKIQ